MRRLLPITLLLLVACNTTEPSMLTIPDWDAIPAGVTHAFCQRLQLDGIGTIGAEVAIVKITQPLASPQALAQVGPPMRPVSIVHRALPIGTVSGGVGGCSWKPIDALDPSRQFDSMVVELSAPVANPAKPGAGMVGRVSLGGTHPNWYWLELTPRRGGWSVGRIIPLSM